MLSKTTKEIIETLKESTAQLKQAQANIDALMTAVHVRDRSIVELAKECVRLREENLSLRRAISDGVVPEIGPSPVSEEGPLWDENEK